MATDREINSERSERLAALGLKPGVPVDSWDLPMPSDDGERPLIQHPLTFSGVLNQVSKTYHWTSDEALRRRPDDALAMRRDAFIKSLLNERKGPTINRRWQLTADDPKDKRKIACAKHLTDCILRMRDWPIFLNYLLEAIWFGKMGAQVTYRNATIMGGVPGVIIGSHQPVHGDKIQFDYYGNPVVFINAASQSRYPKEFVVMGAGGRVPGLRLAKPEWRDQFIIHKHEVDDADYMEPELALRVHGVGIRDYSYWCWWMRDESLSWLLDYLEKLGALGLTIFPYPAGNAKARQIAETNARDYGHLTALTMPVPENGSMEQWKPFNIPCTTAGVEMLRSIVQHYFENHMNRLIVGQSLSAGTEGSGLGGSGVADLHADTKWQLLKYDADNLSNTLTDNMLGPLFRRNKPYMQIAKDMDYEFLRFQLIVPEPADAAAERMSAAKDAASIGVKLDPSDLAQTIGAVEPADNEPATTSPPTTTPTPNKRTIAPGSPAARQLMSLYQVTFDESKHPRDDNGRFVSKGEIHEARSNMGKADELRRQVTDPKERKKLEAALEPRSDFPTLVTPRPDDDAKAAEANSHRWRLLQLDAGTSEYFDSREEAVEVARRIQQMNPFTGLKLVPPAKPEDAVPPAKPAKTWPIPEGIKGAGTKEDPVRCGADIKLAAQMLASDRFVELAQPDEVSTLVDRMSKMMDKAMAQGRKAPTFDLCKISVPKTNLFCQQNLGIPRIEMPQLRGIPLPGTMADKLPKGKKSGKVDLSAAFIEHLAEQGIKSERTEIRASHLRASQRQIVGARVVQLVNETKAGQRDLREKPIFVTRDNYIVDGHHHWAADVVYGGAKGKDWKVPVYRLDMDIGKALSMANEFTKQAGLAPKAAS